MLNRTDNGGLEVVLATRGSFHLSHCATSPCERLLVCRSTDQAKTKVLQSLKIEQFADVGRDRAGQLICRESAAQEALIIKQTYRVC